MMMSSGTSVEMDVMLRLTHLGRTGSGMVCDSTLWYRRMISWMTVPAVPMWAF